MRESLAGNRVQKRAGMDWFNYCVASLFVAYVLYLAFLRNQVTTPLWLDAFILSGGIMKLVFWVVYVPLVCIGIYCSTLKRNIPAILINAAAPALIFVFLRTWEYSHNAGVMMLMTWLLAMTTLFHGLVEQVSNSRHVFRVCGEIIKKGSFLFLLVALPVSLGLQKATVTPEQPLLAMENPWTQGFLLSEHEDTLSVLHPVVWQQMSVGERMDVLQSVSNMETGYLGISPVRLFTSLDHKGAKGHYSFKDQSIWLNRKLVQGDDAWKCLETLFHEVYHHYQYSIVSYEGIDWDCDFVNSVYLFQQPVQWKKELENYVSFRDSGDAVEHYFDQELEKSARLYGLFRVMFYKQEAEALYSEQGEEMQQPGDGQGQ